jgi:hypothetical protein
VAVPRARLYFQGFGDPPLAIHVTPH